MYDSEEPPAKRLCGRNVTLVLNYKDESGRKMQEELVDDSYEISKLSNIIKDTLNDSPDFPSPSVMVPLDVTPEVYHMAIMFERDTSAAHSMSFQDALKVVPFYHKYDFSKGLRLCDRVLDTFITSHSEFDYKSPLGDLDSLVDVMEASGKYHLTDSENSSIKFIASRFKLNAIDSCPHMTAIIFTREHIDKLKPLMQNELTKTDSFLSMYSKEDLGSRKFAKRCKKDLALRYTKRRAFPEKHELSFNLIGSLCEADGKFTMMKGYDYFTGRGRQGKKDGKMISYYIHRRGGDATEWVINGAEDAFELRDGTILWTCPNSEKSKFPPKEGWVAADPYARGASPKIQYII